MKTGLICEDDYLYTDHKQVLSVSQTPVNPNQIIKRPEDGNNPKNLENSIALTCRTNAQFVDHILRAAIFIAMIFGLTN